MTGPTVEGSIVAKVKADISNLEENIALAEAKIEELTGRKPDVTVKANVDTALTKLQAVESATERASAANVRLVAATRALEAAESSEYRKAAILLPARREATDALDAARNASLELAAAQEALSLEQDKTARSASRLNAQGGPRGFFQIALIALAALLPLLGSLVVYLATVSGALVSMAGAGVLAFVGIRKEMAAGTDAGKQYSAGIATIKADFDALSRTAAVALLSDFRSAVAAINQAMPDLNAQTMQLTTILGAVGGNVLQAVINGLRVLNPLFVQGGAYINNVAKGLLAWTQNGGLQRFVSFAVTNFPQVASMLGNLASAAVRIVAAMAPIGTVVVGVLNAFSGAVNGLPLGQLTQIIAAGTGAFLAFKAWSLVAPGLLAVAQAVGAVGVATQIAEGPIGIVSAVIGGLAAILAVAATSTDAATAAQQNYTAAIDASNGAIDENVKKIAAKALLDDGSLAAAKKLGIATSLVVEATTGNVAAQDLLQKKLAAIRTEYDGYAKGQRGLTLTQREQMQALGELTSGYADQSGAIQKTIADNQLLDSSLSSVANTVGTTKAQFDALVAAVSKLPKSVGLSVTTSGQQVFSDARNSANAVKRATGGVIGLGELTLVGEKGPEYARFPTGTTIYPNGVKPAMSSTRIMNNSTKMQSSTSTTQNHWYITETVNAESVAAAVQRRQNLSVA